MTEAMVWPDSGAFLLRLHVRIGDTTDTKAKEGAMAETADSNELAKQRNGEVERHIMDVKIVPAGHEKARCAETP